MNVIVGVDLAEMYVPALRLTVRLGFPDMKLTLVHAVEPLPQTTPPLGPIGVGAVGWMEELRDVGNEVLDRACALVPSGVPCERELADGSAAESLMARADAVHADLIASGAVRQDRLTTLLFGSVSRALATGAKQSVLIVKNEVPGDGPLTAVFATDHSDYANRCFDHFLRWSPKGISKVQVVTAFEMDDPSVKLLKKSMPADSNLESAVQTHLESRGEEAVTRLKAAGYEAGASAIQGHANETLRKAMADAGADLLIMGAQGHGFLERLFIGSTSLQQVMNESYPVLVIRA